MKYVVILGDGMADFKIKELDNKTVLQYAKTPNIDKLAKYSEIGLVKTVPDDMSPGSDVCNLSVLGYDPHKYYSGRSPLEAFSIGVPMQDNDIIFRTNFVTLSDNGESYEDKIILDHSSDEISTEEAKELLDFINDNFKTDEIEFFSGVSYRHIMVWHNAKEKFKLVPPHDILDQKTKDYMPNNEVIKDIMIKSFDLLKNHPVNLKRALEGKRPANSVWIWGEGKKPMLSSFYDKFGLKGSVISAVDLIKGIGKCAKMRSVDVEGATGNIHTNFDGKANAVIEELKNGQDFVYVHIEAPDESGHRNELSNKIKSVEIIDKKILLPIFEYLESTGEHYKIMILPDHPTPISLRTHTKDPVPFMIYNSNKKELKNEQTYDEIFAEKTGIYFEKGYLLMEYFVKK